MVGNLYSTLTLDQQVEGDTNYLNKTYMRKGGVTPLSLKYNIMHIG